MKNYFIIALSLVIAILLIFKGCEENIKQDLTLIKKNKELLNKVDSIDKELAILSVLNDSLDSSYKNVLSQEKEVREVIKNKYIMVYDTITNDTVECLPKKYVDELINIQDSVNKVASKAFKVKDNMISLLIEENALKDTVIINQDIIIEEKDKEIKHEKKKKFGAFLKGLGLGLVGGLFY